MIAVCRAYQLEIVGSYLQSFQHFLYSCIVVYDMNFGLMQWIVVSLRLYRILQLRPLQRIPGGELKTNYPFID